MRRAIYVDGERFGAMQDALGYLAQRRGKRVDYRELRRAADRNGTIAVGRGGGGTGILEGVAGGGAEADGRGAPGFPEGKAVIALSPRGRPAV
ncbi:MAG: hypothetical protein LBQ14_07830 [Treponema sp.]|jgi:hypothetical protein|nr:hypothetical protein [Treponema sp.]